MRRVECPSLAARSPSCLRCSPSPPPPTHTLRHTGAGVAAVDDGALHGRLLLRPHLLPGPGACVEGNGRAYRLASTAHGVPICCLQAASMPPLTAPLPLPCSCLPLPMQAGALVDNPDQAWQREACPAQTLGSGAASGLAAVHRLTRGLMRGAPLPSFLPCSALLSTSALSPTWPSLSLSSCSTP